MDSRISSGTLPVKCRLEEGAFSETRLLSLQRPELDELHSKLGWLFNLRGHYQLKYMDKFGDLVTFSSQEEFKLALVNHMLPEFRVLITPVESHVTFLLNDEAGSVKRLPAFKSATVKSNITDSGRAVKMIADSLSNYSVKNTNTTDASVAARSFTDTLTAAKTATDSTPVVKNDTCSTAAARSATDSTAAAKSATDSAAAVKSAKDSIFAAKSATDSNVPAKSATDSIAAVKSATDSIAAVKSATAIRSVGGSIKAVKSAENPRSTGRTATSGNGDANARLVRDARRQDEATLLQDDPVATPKSDWKSVFHPDYLRPRAIAMPRKAGRGKRVTLDLQAFHGRYPSDAPSLHPERRQLRGPRLFPPPPMSPPRSPRIMPPSLTLQLPPPPPPPAPLPQSPLVGSDFVHFGIDCSRCGAEPLVGWRFKCSQCPNYNLCRMCFDSFAHGHGFYRLP